jgi:hypothetical protein
LSGCIPVELVATTLDVAAGRGVDDRLEEELEAFDTGAAPATTWWTHMAVEVVVDVVTAAAVDDRVTMKFGRLANDASVDVEAPPSPARRLLCRGTVDIRCDSAQPAFAAPDADELDPEASSPGTTPPADLRSLLPASRSMFASVPVVVGRHPTATLNSQRVTDRTGP